MTKATIRNGYRARLALIGIGFSIFGALCVYDALVKYPRQIKQFERFVELRDPQNPNWQEQWIAEAESRGWSSEEPVERKQSDIHVQWVMAAIVFPIGLIFTWGLLRSLTRFVALDDNVLTADGGRRTELSAITELDDRRWKTKGISAVHYSAEGGPTGLITLDDWKFDRDATVAIHDTIAAHLAARSGATTPPATPADDAASAEVPPPTP